MKTIRVRRSRPGPIRLAVALMLTMLFVYLITLSAREAGPDARPVAAQQEDTAEIHLDALEAGLICVGLHADAGSARIAAARCAQAGGAGLVLPAEDGYAVVERAYADAETAEARLTDDDSAAFILTRGAGGLTLRLSGTAAELTAVTDGLDFLRAQGSETVTLADTLDSGETDISAALALLKVYRVRGQDAVRALSALNSDDSFLTALLQAVRAAADRLEPRDGAQLAAGLRLNYAAARLDLIELMRLWNASTQNGLAGNP